MKGIVEEGNRKTYWTRGAVPDASTIDTSVSTVRSADRQD